MRSLCEKLDFPVNIDSPRDQRLLRRLWAATVGRLFSSRGESVPGFAPISPFWKLAGFQRETPLTDFRGGGVLSLEHMVVFAENHPDLVMTMMHRKSGETWKWKRGMRGSLPFAICCINLSVMIIKTIQLDHCTLSDDAVQMAKLPFWPLADSPAFLTQLFDVVAEITFNSVNLEEAVFLRFPAFLREVELAVKRVVETEVSTIEAFRLHLIDETAALRNGLPANFAVPRETDPAASCDQTEVAEGSTVSPVILEAVAQYLRQAPKGWELVFCSENGGKTSDLLEAARGLEKTVFLASDRGSFCGSFQESPWRYSGSFYGEGESVVFKGETEKPGEIEWYPWSRKNMLNRVSTERGLAVGGGGRHAILVDEALRWGSSGECQAFASPCLMDMEEFACESVELWRMIV